MGGRFDSVTFNRSMPYDVSLAGSTECDYVLTGIIERNLADLGQMQFLRRGVKIK